MVWCVFHCEDARRLIGLILQLSRLKNWPFSHNSLTHLSFSFLVFTLAVEIRRLKHAWSTEQCFGMPSKKKKKKKMTSGAFDKQILAASQNNSHRETAKCMTIWYAVLFKAVFFLTKVIAEWQNKLLKQTEVRRVVCFKTLFYMYIYFAFCMRSQETQKSSQILTLSHEKKH